MRQYDIKPELLMQYAKLILFMDSTKSSVSLYSTIDKRRAEIHNQILLSVNKTRDDKDFSFWLASVTEKIIKELTACCNQVCEDLENIQKNHNHERRNS